MLGAVLTQMIQKFTRFTNIYLDKLKSNYDTAREYRPIEAAKINAPLRLLLMARVKNALPEYHRIVVEWLYCSRMFQVDDVEKKFSPIIGAVRFDNVNDRNEDKKLILNFRRKILCKCRTIIKLADIAQLT